MIICSLNYALHHLPEISSKAGFKQAKAQLALVKPNICGIYNPSLDLLSSVVEFLSYAESVVIGETSSMMHDPEEQFRRLGIKDLIQLSRRNVRAVDLSNDNLVEIRVSNPHVLKEIEFPKTVLDSDILVNVPKAGTHPATSLTCSLKNLFGLLPIKRKYSTYHPLGMDKVIADIAQAVNPSLNIVEVGDKVILGVDALAVDAVACRFLNLDPLKIGHLRLISEDRGVQLKDLLSRLRVMDF